MTGKRKLPRNIVKGRIETARNEALRYDRSLFQTEEDELTEFLGYPAQEALVDIHQITLTLPNFIGPNTYPQLIDHTKNLIRVENGLIVFKKLSKDHQTLILKLARRVTPEALAAYLEVLRRNPKFDAWEAFPKTDYSASIMADFLLVSQGKLKPRLFKLIQKHHIENYQSTMMSLLYILSEIYGERPVSSVLMASRKQKISLTELEVLSLVPNWEKVKEMPLDWAVHVVDSVVKRRG